MRIDGHYDVDADIAWIRFDGYDPKTVVAEETDIGLRELDPATDNVVGIEVWHASERLPEDFLRMLPPPRVEIAA